MYVVGGIIVDGKVFWVAYDGELWANDVSDGKLLWKFGPIYAGLETPYAVYPLYGGMTVADGKIIVMHGEHSANSPLYKGEKMYCLNMSDGAKVWEMPGWWQQPVAANGLLIAPNCYDAKNYVFGKGPTKTTVSASPQVMVKGDSVLIQGMVTDISAGAMQSEQSKRFPDGLPAVSDESMTQWMEYVYQQKPIPSNATGVTVSIDVLDANGNYRNIGSATSDATGFYSFAWKPDIPGKFSVYATFAGSESYYTSFAETAFVADEAPAAPAEPEPAPPTMAEQYFLPVSIGMIVAIAVVGALVVLLLVRKRP
jgi:hypothetical protein